MHYILYYMKFEYFKICYHLFSGIIIKEAVCAWNAGFNMYQCADKSIVTYKTG